MSNVQRCVFTDAAGTVVSVEMVDLDPDPGSLHVTPDQWCAINGYAAWSASPIDEPAHALYHAKCGDSIGIPRAKVGGSLELDEARVALVAAVDVAVDEVII